VVCEQDAFPEIDSIQDSYKELSFWTAAFIDPEKEVLPPGFRL